MTTPSLPAPSEPGFFTRLGRAFVRTLRWLFNLALLAAVIAAVYFGAPLLYNRYLAPLEDNTARLESQIEDQAAQIASLQTRILALESAQAEDEQSLGALQSGQEDLQTRLEAAESALEALDALQTRLDELQAELQTSQEGQEALSAEMEAVQRQIQILGTLQSLSRARLYLMQSNYGLAQIDLEVAYNQVSAISMSEEARQGVLDNLQRAREALPAQPVVAIGHLDFAWARLLELVAPPAQLPPPPITPTPSLTPTPTAAP